MRPKLTPLQVAEIRRRYGFQRPWGRGCEKLLTLAIEFNVSEAHVSRLVSGKRRLTNQPKPT